MNINIRYTIYNIWILIHRTGKLENAVGQSASRFEWELHSENEWIILCFTSQSSLLLSIKELIKIGAMLPFYKSSISRRKFTREYFQRLELFSYPLWEKRHFFSFLVSFVDIFLFVFSRAWNSQGIFWFLILLILGYSVFNIKREEHFEQCRINRLFYFHEFILSVALRRFKKIFVASV